MMFFSSVDLEIFKEILFAELIYSKIGFLWCVALFSHTHTHRFSYPPPQSGYKTISASLKNLHILCIKHGYYSLLLYDSNFYFFQYHINRILQYAVYKLRRLASFLSIALLRHTNTAVCSSSLFLFISSKLVIFHCTDSPH